MLKFAEDTKSTNRSSSVKDKRIYKIILTRWPVGLMNGPWNLMWRNMYAYGEKLTAILICNEWSALQSVTSDKDIVVIVINTHEPSLH